MVDVPPGESGGRAGDRFSPGSAPVRRARPARAAAPPCTSGRWPRPCPASKTPKRVQTEPASSAAPETSADSSRLRPPSSAPAAPAAVSTLLARSSRPALPGVQRLGGQAHRCSIRWAAASSTRRAGHRERAGRAGLGDGARSGHRRTRPTAQRAAGEDERQLGVGRRARPASAVSASSTAVYVASAGAVTAAAARPAGRADGGSSRRGEPEHASARAAAGASSATAARPAQRRRTRSGSRCRPTSARSA